MGVSIEDSASVGALLFLFLFWEDSATFCSVSITVSEAGEDRTFPTLDTGGFCFPFWLFSGRAIAVKVNTTLLKSRSMRSPSKSELWSEFVLSEFSPEELMNRKFGKENGNKNASRSDIEGTKSPLFSGFLARAAFVVLNKAGVEQRWA